MSERAQFFSPVQSTLTVPRSSTGIFGVSG
jgi:hypothetical protein